MLHAWGRWGCERFGVKRRLGCYNTVPLIFICPPACLSPAMEQEPCDIIALEGGKQGLVPC